MNGADAGAGQHGKGRFGNHGHVDQDPVAFLYAQLFQNGSHPLHFRVQLAEGIHLLLIGLGGDENQRCLLCAILKMPVHGVVAQIGGATYEPLGKWWVAVIANLLGRSLPVDKLRLLRPKAIAFSERAAVEFCVCCH